MIKPRKKYRRRFLVVGRKPIEEYSVVITSGGNGSVTVDGVTGDYVATVPDGTVLTVSATADAHYGFTAWSDGETDNPRTITVTGDLNLTASFAIDTYIVNVIAGSNGSVSVNGTVGNYSQLVAYGTQLEIAATPAMGYDFTAWSDGVSSASRTVTVTGDVTLSAAFAIQTFTVSISAGANGSVSVNGTPGDYIQTVNYGTALVLEATPSTGYDFTMWSDGDGNSQRIIAVTGDVTLSAAFAIQTFSVSVTAGQNGSVSVNGVSGNYSQTVSYGTVLTVEATGNTGYSFTQWSDGSSANPRTVTVTSDLSLTSAYAIQTFSVSLSAGANGSISVNGTPVVGTYTDTVSYGTQLTVEATGDTGYDFYQWSDGTNTNPRSLTVTSNVTLSAAFELAVQPSALNTILYTTTDNQVNSTWVTAYNEINNVMTPTETGHYGRIVYGEPVHKIVINTVNASNIESITTSYKTETVGYSGVNTLSNCTSLTLKSPQLASVDFTPFSALQYIESGHANSSVQYIGLDSVPTGGTCVTRTDNDLWNNANISTWTFQALGTVITYEATSQISLNSHNVYNRKNGPLTAVSHTFADGVGTITYSETVGELRNTWSGPTKVYLPDTVGYLTNISWLNYNIELGEYFGVVGGSSYASQAWHYVNPIAGGYPPDKTITVKNTNPILTIGTDGCLYNKENWMGIQVAGQTMVNDVITEMIMDDRCVDASTCMLDRMHSYGFARLVLGANCQSLKLFPREGWGDWSTHVDELVVNDALKTINLNKQQLVHASGGSSNPYLNVTNSGYSIESEDGTTLYWCGSNQVDLSGYANFAEYCCHRIGFTSATFGNSAASIGAGAFLRCTSLTSITFNSTTTVPTVNSTAFNNVASSGTVYGQAGLNYSTVMSRLPSGWTLAVPCTVSVTAGANGSITVNNVPGPYSDTVMSGTQLTLEATGDAGYTFTQWSDGNTSNPRTLTVTSNTTLSAAFAIQAYSVTLSAGANGSISVNGTPVVGTYTDNVAYGTQLTIEATPDSHYSFTAWSDGVSTNPRTLTVTSNTTLSAAFAIDTYSVTLSAGANGSISVNGTPVVGTYTDTVNYGTTLTLEATGDTGYAFSQWSDGNSDNPRSLTVTSNTTLTASFQAAVQPADEIWYTSTNNQVVTPYGTNFGVVTMTSNTYSGGKGVIKLSGNLQTMAECFKNCTTLATITLPTTMTQIGYDTFNGCTSLTGIDIPANVTTIGQRCFNGCTNLSSATIGSSVTSISDDAFKDCSSLTSVVIPNSVTTLGTNVFMSCTDLASVTLGSGLTALPENTFRVCTSLTSVTIPSGLTSIGNSVFTGCSTLSSITFQSTTTVPTLGTNVFQAVASTGTVYGQGGLNYSTVMAALPVGWSLVQPYAVTLSAGANGSISVNGTPVVGTYTDTVSSGTQLTLAATGDAGYTFTQWSDGNTDNPRTLTVTSDVTLTASFQAAVQPDYFYIEDASGSQNTLTLKKSQISFPTIMISTSTDKINWTSPQGFNTNGITFTVPANGKLYLKATTDRWNNGVYKSLMYCSGNFNVGGCIASLLFGDNYENAVLTSSNNYAFAGIFQGDTTLVSASDLILPDNVAYSCYSSMFSGCTSLTTAPALPATTIDTGCYSFMFSGCTSLTTAPALPATTMAQDCYSFMFDGCIALTTAPALPGTTMALSCYQAMFRGCTGITTSPTLPATTLAQTCYNAMFYNCTNMSDVTIYADDISATNCLGNWLTNVAATGTFHNLGSATYPSGASGIPSGWTEVKPHPNDEIWYTSTDDQVVTPAYPAGIQDANGNTLSILSNTYSGGKGVIKLDGDLAALMPTGNYGIFERNLTLQSVSLPDSVETIGDSTFYSCTSLTSLTIPNSVTSIGKYAIQKCTSLTSVTIPDSVTTIGAYAFSDCSGLTSLTIPNSVTSIGNIAFKNCSGLTGTLTIPNSVTSIGQSAFEGCSGLTSVTIGSSVTSIGSKNFYGCTSLTSVTIPNSVTTIGAGAFQNCTSLTSVTIPNSVTTININAFNGCTSLVAIESLATTAPTIASSSFRSVAQNGTLTVPSGSDYSSWMQTGNYYLGLYNWTLVQV